MTKKDYEVIARVLRAERANYVDEWTMCAIERVARAFADELAATNPRFKRDVFLRACGVESSS